MTTPAEDCGVAAGCGACPLGRAGVCGDPGTERDAPTVTINDRGFLRRAAVPAPGSSYFRMFDAPAHDQDPAPAVDWVPIADASLVRELARVTGAPPLDARPITREEFARRVGDSAGDVIDRDDPWPGWDKPNGDPVPVCVQTPSGVVPCGSARLCRSPEEVAEVRSFTGPHLPALACASHGCERVPGAGNWRAWPTDTPDRDPAEPRPADAGCCGGGCGG